MAADAAQWSFAYAWLLSGWRATSETPCSNVVSVGIGHITEVLKNLMAPLAGLLLSALFIPCRCLLIIADNLVS